MALKVIGAGFGRTGTMSLKTALEQLGFSKCYHMFEVSLNEGHVELWRAIERGEDVDLHALFEGYQATVDWPSCNYWESQLAAFPDAKVILSLRDPESWYRSVMKTIYPSSVAGRQAKDPVLKARVEMIFEVIWDGVFDGRMDDKDHVISVFNAHNQYVQDTLPADRLLVFEARQGWQPLCEFLEVPVPAEDYPKTNTTEDFLAMVAARTQAD
jgi:hypothetical protein